LWIRGGYGNHHEEHAAFKHAAFKGNLKPLCSSCASWLLRSFVFRVFAIKLNLSTYWKLGFVNLLRVAYYKFQLHSGQFQKRLPIGKPISAPFFKGSRRSTFNTLVCPDDASLLLQGQLRYFSHQLTPVSDPPDWFVNPETGVEFPNKGHWSTIGDFGHGDIKLIWEPSRFQWLVLAAQGCATTEENDYLALINRWLSDWSEKNPLNQGANWKCAQESSIRLMNLLMAALILGEYQQPTPALVQMVREHGQRIYPTLHYAIAQDNNHGTSEVSALFIAGAWLKRVGKENFESTQWLLRGRSGLEERTAHLVEKDGSFSQHSVNYHRLFLETISLVEFWRKECDQPAFSASYYQRVTSAIDWLWQMTDPVTGDVPNLGANDGAQLLQLAGSSYRDFRPSVQFVSAMFMKKRVCSKECDGLLEWFGFECDSLTTIEERRSSKLFEDGGYASLVGESCSGVLRFPRFRFRPSHADLMHLEIMDQGISVVRDGGSYSYNTDVKWLNYFPGVESHNTIEFDRSEPMPRLSRFLFGKWPEVDSQEWVVSESETRWSGGYKDYLGRIHHRTVQLDGRKWQIEDIVSGFTSSAILRWRLIPAEWVLDGEKIISDKATILIETNGVVIERMELVDGWESRYYNAKSQVLVLEVEIRQAGTLFTKIELPSLHNR
jgi:hypothetical protein